MRSTSLGSGSRRCSESTEIAGAGDQQAAALGVGVIEPGTVSVVLGTSGVVLAALPGYEHDAAGPRPRLLPRGAGDVGGDGRHAQRRRSAALVPRRRRAGHVVRRADVTDAGTLRAPARAARPSFRTSRESEHPHADPDADGLLLGPLASARSRRARPSGARRRRLRPARLARAAARARRRPDEGSRVRGRRAESASGSRSSRPCSACRSSALSSTRAQPTVRRSLQASPADRSQSAHDAVASCVRVRDDVEPNPDWARPYDGGLRSLSRAVPGHPRSGGAA